MSAGVGARFARVLEQVDQRLLDLRGVEADDALRRRARQRELHDHAQPFEQDIPGHGREPRLRQLRELRITFDEAGEMTRAVFDGGEHAAQLLGVRRRARQDLAGMRERGDRRERVVQLVRDDADHLLPGRHFLRIDLARELLEQQQPMRQGVQQEAALRHVVDLRLAAELEREQRVAAALDGLAQRRRRRLEVTREAFALELASLAEELARARRCCRARRRRHW